MSWQNQLKGDSLSWLLESDFPEVRYLALRDLAENAQGAEIDVAQAAAHKSGPIATILDTKLPIVDRSISELVDIAAEVANKINAILADPAGAVQELNRSLANAVGLDPVVTTTQQGKPDPGGVNEIQRVVVSNFITKFQLKFGDEVTVLPSGRTTRVKEIVTYDGELQTAFAPQSVTITLADEIDISRGDMFVKSSAHPPKVEKELEATLCWLSESPLDKNRKYLVKHTTRTAKCLFSRLDYRVDVNTLEQHAADKLNMNDIAHVALKIQQPLVFDSYTTDRATGSFIVIDEATNNTVAAGMIA